MLTDFFYHLKERKLPVSITEYLALLEALSAGLANYNLDDFYTLSRICLIKNEAHYDRFDLAFGDYFKSILTSSGDSPDPLPAQWLQEAAAQLFSDQEYTQILPKPEETTLELEQKPHHETQSQADDSTLLINAHGNSPLGQGGIFQDNALMDGESSGNHRVIKTWDSRQFKGLDNEAELNTRNIQMALRRLRKFAREGVPDELDMEDTIRSTARNAGWLELKMRPERRNQVRVLMLFDTGGSMESHIRQCQELFSAARSEFRNLEYYYFHNCVYDTVWQYTSPSVLSHYPLHKLMQKHDKTYKLIFVGDAFMSPVEILEPGRGYHGESWTISGEVRLRSLLAHYRHAVWLCPEAERFWATTQSIQIIRGIMDNRMFPLTIAGIDEAMKVLSK